MSGMSYQAPRRPAPWRLWVRGHKVLTVLGAIAFLVVISVAAQASNKKGTPSPRATPAAATTRTPSPSPSPTTAAPSPRAVRTTAPPPIPATTRAAPPPQSPPATTAAAPPATQAGCYPLSNEGTCYEPGEYCRASDHGASGVAGDGERITCEDNDGWRWEPT